MFFSICLTLYLFWETHLFTLISVSLCRVAVRQVAALCRGMMLQISALQAKVAHLEEEKRSQEEQLGLKFKERYDPLVRHLSSTCIQLKVGHLIIMFEGLLYK